MEGESREKKGNFLIWTVFTLLAGLLVYMFFAFVPYGTTITGNSISMYDGLTTKLVCKQQPYEEEEKYTEIVSGKNCDYKSGCSCIHKSWLGLGACDSCECKGSRTVTKYTDVCIQIKKWQSPNYNENWLNYNNLYSRDGKPVVSSN